MTAAPVQPGILDGMLPKFARSVGFENIKEQVGEFGRARDVELRFSIKRGLLYRWLREGKIRSISLREPGRKFGPRIFWMPEIRAILLKKLAAQNPESEL